jgi:hypothetical protein
MRVNLDELLSGAIRDPAAIAGRKLGPSWGRGNDGYAREEETLPQWQVRAVAAALDNAGALLPDDGRLATFRPGNTFRDSAVIIQLDGPYVIFRFLVNVLHQQVEFAAAARAALVELRDHMGADRFDPMARSLLGDDRYEKLRGRFLRNFSCVSCERDIRVGMRYAPTDDAGAACAACCKGFPDEQKRLVKRQPEPALAGR